MSILAKKLSKVIFTPAFGEVLDIDVVECFSHVSSVLRLISLNDERSLSVFGLFDSLLGGIGLLEADKSVLSRGVVLVERNLKTLDITVLLEVFFELRSLDFSRDLSHKNIMVN